MRHAHPEKSFNVSRWALEHDALTRFLMIVLMLLGVAAYFQLGQDEDPPFTFRAMVVRTYWPGATAQQVAEQVTDKLERTLQEAPFADKIRSYSKPGESQIIFQIKDSSKAADVPNVWYSVRKKIGDMKGTLPQGVIGPFFNDEFGDVYGVIYALESDGFSYAELKTFADDVRQQLLRVPDVAKVELFGVQDEKLYIEISQKRLAQLGLDMNAVLAQLGQQNAVESAGAVQTPLDVVQVRVAGQFNAVEDLRAMPIRGASGNQLRLSDIADIRRGYADPPSIKVRHQGKEVIALGVSMTKGGDIIELGKSLKTVTDHFDKALPLGMKLVQVQDQPKAVANSVNEFIKVLIEAVAIVLAVIGLAQLPQLRCGRFCGSGSCIQPVSTRANSVTSACAAGYIKVKCGGPTGASTDFIVDVVGYYDLRALVSDEQNRRKLVELAAAKVIECCSDECPQHTVLFPGDDPGIAEAVAIDVAGCLPGAVARPIARVSGELADNGSDFLSSQHAVFVDWGVVTARTAREAISRMVAAGARQAQFIGIASQLDVESERHLNSLHTVWRPAPAPLGQLELVVSDLKHASDVSGRSSHDTSVSVSFSCLTRIPSTTYSHATCPLCLAVADFSTLARSAPTDFLRAHAERKVDRLRARPRSAALAWQPGR